MKKILILIALSSLAFSAGDVYCVDTGGGYMYCYDDDREWVVNTDG